MYFVIKSTIKSTAMISKNVLFIWVLVDILNLREKRKFNLQPVIIYDFIRFNDNISERIVSAGQRFHLQAHQLLHGQIQRGRSAIASRVQIHIFGHNL